jgi:hypothetical protein
MHADAEMALFYKFANAPINYFPYPHFYIQDVFPQDFYDRLQQALPDPSLMVPIEKARSLKGYEQRFVLEISVPEYRDTLPPEKRDFWAELAGWMCSGRFAQLALQKFQPFVQQRFKGSPQADFYNEAMLVEDVTKYALGPHTDSPKKVITMLFYLPKDLSQSHMGTSIYLPNDPAFRCQGGPHYKFDGFKRLHTMPFVPNSLFVFFKTDNSFHGVEPVTDPNTKRWLLLYDIYVRQPQNASLNPAGMSPAKV